MTRQETEFDADARAFAAAIGASDPRRPLPPPIRAGRLTPDRTAETPAAVRRDCWRPGVGVEVDPVAHVKADRVLDPESAAPVPVELDPGGAEPCYDNLGAAVERRAARLTAALDVASAIAAGDGWRPPLDPPAVAAGAAPPAERAKPAEDGAALDCAVLIPGAAARRVERLFARPSAHSARATRIDTPLARGLSVLATAAAMTAAAAVARLAGELDFLAEQDAALRGSGLPIELEHIVDFGALGLRRLKISIEI